jgi:RNA polymerase sigma-70 factor, ECF subfamily
MHVTTQRPGPEEWPDEAEIARSGGAKRDSDLIAELQSPESDALAVLFRRYLRLVNRIAAGILRDEGEAEDVAQEVFFEIYRKAHLYDPSRGPVKGWLLQYAYHRSLRRRDALRRRAAYRGAPLEEADARKPRHRDRLTREECRWMIRRGLAQLPERQRKALELACLQDLSLRDVAERLRISLGAARHYYYRGLTRLRAWAQRGDAKGGSASRSSHAASGQGPARRTGVPMITRRRRSPRDRRRADGSADT